MPTCLRGASFLRHSVVILLCYFTMRIRMYFFQKSENFKCCGSPLVIFHLKRNGVSTTAYDNIQWSEHDDFMTTLLLT